ncbi:hypothetical protein MBLNU230_g2527t1 [Neophaeotheca triangularis]
MPTVLVSGAANGLGAAFVDAYRNRPDTQVLALDRETIASTHNNVKTFTVDVTSQDSIDRFTETIRGEAIDLLVHSAGIRGLVPTAEDRHPDDVAACETMDVMDPETMHRTFQINATGTFMLLRAVTPNLQKAQSAKVVVMSSRMGSLGNNEAGIRAAGSAYAYRASKAALNAIVRSFAVDVQDVTYVLCHPGRVESKLVRCFEEGAISAEESVSGLLPLIDRWDNSDSGKFYDRFGDAIQW